MFRKWLNKYSEKLGCFFFFFFFIFVYFFLIFFFYTIRFLLQPKIIKSKAPKKIYNDNKSSFYYFCSQLTRAYFAFLEVLFSSHINVVLNLDTSTFMHIVGSLESGLKGLDTNISSQVCQPSIEYSTYYYSVIFFIFCLYSNCI